MSSRDFRILVIDNGSRDGSVEYLRANFPQIEVVANGKNLGFAAGCNGGIRRALQEGAEFVLLVNNDTVADPAMLRELLNVAEREPEAAIVSPKIFYFDPPDRLWWAGGRYSLWLGMPRHVGFMEKDCRRYSQPCELDWATGCVMLLRCQALGQAGLFDERMFGNGEDLDLSLRVRESGWKIVYAPLAMVWHKEGSDYRKNVGEHVRKFTYIRNLLWVMHKHARPLQWFTFWPFFLLWTFSIAWLRCIARRDTQSAKALFGGVEAYFRMVKCPDAQALPAELIRTTLPLQEASSPGLPRT
jgi:GT2 family glycosyltransferase